jgi:hypothetical protein
VSIPTGEIEWEEFLVAMSEDTTMLNSDNEDNAEHPLHTVNSTYSMTGLALSGSSSAVEKPVRSRHSSSTPVLDPQQIQYQEVLSVNNVSAAAEVFVPEVKEAPLFRTLSVLNLMEEGASKGSAAGGSSSSIAPAKPKSSSSRRDNERDTASLMQQIATDKRNGGYDCELGILPARLRASNEVYVDYDADSEDERFVSELQAKLRKSCGNSVKSSPPKAGAVKKEVASSDPTNAEPLRVRCVELMIARLEREFELSRLFCSRPPGKTCQFMQNYSISIHANYFFLLQTRAFRQKR